MIPDDNPNYWRCSRSQHTAPPASTGATPAAERHTPARAQPSASSVPAPRFTVELEYTSGWCRVRDSHFDTLILRMLPAWQAESAAFAWNSLVEGDVLLAHIEAAPIRSYDGPCP